MEEVRAYSISARDIEGELARSPDGVPDVSKILRLDTRPLPPLGPADAKVRVLAVSLEHNILHAALADTINIARERGGKMFPGNSALGEVVEVGPAVRRFRPGDIVITQGNGELDRHGYPKSIWAYDQIDSVGCYAEAIVVAEQQLLAAPLDCGLNLWEIAALPVRAPSAYHLWRRALGILRLKVAAEQLPRLNVLAFGGGVGELFLMLAKHEGHHAYYCSGNQQRRSVLADMGIRPIDQLRFQRFQSEGDVKEFAAECKRLTDGAGMHVVCDMFRGPLFAAGLAASARCGVNVSSGWKLSKQVQYSSPLLSVKQITLDHMHYETVAGCEAATALYGAVFRPQLHERIYAFEELTEGLRELHLNVQNGIPVVRVAADLPAKVAALAAR